MDEVYSILKSQIQTQASPIRCSSNLYPVSMMFEMTLLVGTYTMEDDLISIILATSQILSEKDHCRHRYQALVAKIEYSQ